MRRSDDIGKGGATLFCRRRWTITAGRVVHSAWLFPPSLCFSLTLLLLSLFSPLLIEAV
jgi:hypothetical protein